jgi:predicted Zn-dependent peptidase
LYRSLVRDKKIALLAQGFSGFPGSKYPHLFAFYAVSAPGHTPKELEDGIHAEIDKLKNEYVTDEELKMVKTRERADLIRGLADNSGLAEQLAIYQARYGDWRELFRQLDRLDKVTKEDVKRVANQVFTPENRTVGMIETARPAPQPKAAGQSPGGNPQASGEAQQPKGGN